MLGSMFSGLMCCFFQAEDGIRDLVRSRGLGDVYKRQSRGRSGRFRRHNVASVGRGGGTRLTKRAASR